MNEPLNTIVLVLTFLVMLVGLVGTVVPVVPGPILIFAGALLYALLDGFQALGWGPLVILGVITIVAITADLWASSIGAKAGGASVWSIVAGVAASITGFLLLNLPGAILGAVLGVLGAEMLRVKDWRKALKAGGGWLLGWLLSVVVQLGLGVVMIAIFAYMVLGGS